jgi:tetratricopeptide (TPR) repeat protein
MSKFAIRVLTVAMFSMALVAAPLVTNAYANPDSNAPPPPSSNKSSKAKKKTSELTPRIEDAAFASGYRAAYATIYERNDYASAIEQLKALGHDDIAAVANLIGYSYRKLGDYKLSQIWYERALKADPNHVKTWQYYGLWQVEQGNRDQAQYHLSRIAALAGTNSEEYRSLAAALEKPPGTGLVY